MVSVIIATYRREESLLHALQSLVPQTYRDFEVVIIDDNADLYWNNKVLSVLSKFKSALKLKYIQNETNQGSARSRNIGIANTEGEYITFLDDDDLYLPTKIQHQVELMMSDNADYSLSNLSLYNEDETLFENRTRDYLATDESRNLLLCHLKYHMTGTDTMMFKKEYIKSFGGFEPIDVGDEFYLMLKAIERNGRFVYCNTCDVKAYVHLGDGGLSSGKKKIDGEKRLFLFKKQYFSKLKAKDRRYIKMRHHAVLAFAYKRDNHPFLFFKEAICAGLISPLQSIKLVRNLK